MTDPMQHRLLGHLLGALDDAEQQSVDARLEHDEECCRELARWRRRLASLEALRPDFEPPPGLAERTCRYVAASMPTPAVAHARDRRRMSPVPVPPSHVDRVGWLDVAVVALLLVTAGAVILPAIDSSRFQARVAACQEGLRHFGLALSQYSHQQHSPLGTLANNGRLTPAGVLAAGLLQDTYLPESHRAVCPEAWLATQGLLRDAVAASTSDETLQDGWIERSGLLTLTANPGPQPEVNDDQSGNWPGTWRDGTRNGWRLPPSAAEVPLLADAPSADLPGHRSASHGGRGRNVLFEDGRVNFVSSTGPTDTAEAYPAPGTFSSRGISAPIVLVSGH